MTVSHQIVARDFRYAALFAGGMLAILIATWLAYLPGLSGNYLFDDFINLNALGENGRVHDWPSLLRYLTSGKADPTGRPLTLLSFLLDAQDWPTDPWPFKRTNVLLHMLNGSLLCWTMLLLGKAAGLTERHGRRAALLGMAVWLLHPLFVSTTLYIVQREAMLPATFTFGGFICWCKGRMQLRDGNVMGAWMLLVAGSVLCTLLAVLSKANGALLPLLLAVAELTVLRPLANGAKPSERHVRWPTWALLYVPIALLALAILAEIPSAIRNAAENRPWTIAERLLTEPRVIVDYLRLLWLPRVTSFGIFNDQVVVSTSWFTPWTTAPCLLAALTICALGWRLRKTRPLLAFAILFFLAGHAMESTFLPLELSFEHRNYLPAAFMFWPLAAWFTTESSGWLRPVFIIVIVAGVGTLTRTRAEVWGDSRQQALIWGLVNPNSPRAQAFAASIEMDHGQHVEAMARLRAAEKKMPGEVQLTLNLANAECAAGEITASTWKNVIYSLHHATSGAGVILNWFLAALPQAQARACRGLTLERLQEALTAAQGNPKYGQQSGRRQDYAYIGGQIALANAQPERALVLFNQALSEAPNPGAALKQAAALGAAGYPKLGLQHLKFAQSHTDYAVPSFGMPRIHAWLLERQRYWELETTHLQQVLEEDASNASEIYTAGHRDLTRGGNP